MTPTNYTLERVLANGGGISINAENHTSYSLERFASFAAQSGATLIIRNAGTLTSYTLERVAAFGGGKVIFEF